MSPQNVRYTGRDAARWLCQLAITVCMSGQGIAQAGTLLVFGDSLSDTGRVWATSQTTLGQELPPSGQGLYWQGRFSNGPVAVEVMADALGLTLNSQAWGGALTGRSNLLGADGDLGRSGMLDQVDQWFAQSPTLGADTLVVLWGGLNDLVLSPQSSTVSQALHHLNDAATTLIAAGARQLILPSSPNLASTPLVQAMGPAAAGRYQSAMDEFNTGLGNLVTQLSAAHPEVHVFGFDSAQVLAQAAIQAQWDTSQACIEGGFWGVESVCPQPDTHLFWDGTHPSAAAHRQLGLAMAQAIPEPDTWLLMGLGLAAGTVLRAAQSRRASKAPA